MFSRHRKYQAYVRYDRKTNNRETKKLCSATKQTGERPNNFVRQSNEPGEGRTILFGSKTDRGTTEQFCSTAKRTGGRPNKFARQ
jgi:hypothetical protein